MNYKDVFFMRFFECSKMFSSLTKKKIDVFNCFLVFSDEEHRKKQIKDFE